MILKLAVLLAALGCAVNAQNLRKENTAVVESNTATTENVLTDDVRGAKALEGLLNGMQIEHQKKLKEHKEKHSSIESTNKAHAAKVDLAGLNQISYDGYMVKRTRPNSDCSGDVRVMSGTALGVCYDDAPNTYKMGCMTNTEDNHVYAMRAVFNNNDCSGPTGDVFMYNRVAQCGIDFSTVNTNGFESVSYQCATNVDPFAANATGIVYSTYYQSDCGGKPVLFTNQRFDSCFLSMRTDSTGLINEHTDYQYMKLLECTKDGKLKIQAFADSQCHRQSYIATVDIVDPKGSFNSCTMQEGFQDWYQSIRCVNPHSGGGGPKL